MLNNEHQNKDRDLNNYNLNNKVLRLPPGRFLTTIQHILKHYYNEMHFEFMQMENCKTIWGWVGRVD